MKESSKNTLMRSTWAGHVDKCEMISWQREQNLESEGEMATKNTDVAMGIALKVTWKEWEKNLKINTRI